MPLARLAAAATGRPGDGRPCPTPAFSDALYFAVECQDYDFVPPGTDGRGTAGRLAGTARRPASTGLRLGDGVYGDLPACSGRGRRGRRPGPATGPTRRTRCSCSARTPIRTPRCATPSRLLERTGDGDAALRAAAADPT